MVEEADLAEDTKVVVLPEDTREVVPVKEVPLAVTKEVVLLVQAMVVVTRELPIVHDTEAIVLPQIVDLKEAVTKEAVHNLEAREPVTKEVVLSPIDSEAEPTRSVEYSPVLHGIPVPHTEETGIVPDRKAQDLEEKERTEEATKLLEAETMLQDLHASGKVETKKTSNHKAPSRNFRDGAFARVLFSGGKIWIVREIGYNRANEYLPPTHTP